MSQLENMNIKGAILSGVPMRRYTSMKVGGPVEYLIYPDNTAELMKIVIALKEEGIPYRFAGNGTNIIVHDRGIKGAVIRVTRFRSLRYKKTEDGAMAEVSGGISLKGFIKKNAWRGLSGLEKLYGIPGTVGGGIRMNAGSFGVSISDALKQVNVVNGLGRHVTLGKDDLSFAYRVSPIKPSDCVISAVFCLKEKEKDHMLSDMEYVHTERMKRHPMEYPSSGSIFKAVNGEPAWRFIEKAGLRGFSMGDASVSEKHANFIINRGGARAGDIKRLIDEIKRTVFEETGVSLKEEVELWGFDE